MNMDITNTIMDRLEHLTDMMLTHQQEGNWPAALLLAQEARQLSDHMDAGKELMTLPVM